MTFPRCLPEVRERRRVLCDVLLRLSDVAEWWHRWSRSTTNKVLDWAYEKVR